MRQSRERQGRKGTRGQARLATQVQAHAQSIPLPLVMPHPRLRKHANFASHLLPDRRDITVYLPPGYEADEERGYPLLILQDGQNLFDPATSFIPGRTWRVAETADEAIAAGLVEPLIIVGVANAGERRIAEYTPTRDWKLGGGEAARGAAAYRTGRIVPGRSRLAVAGPALSGSLRAARRAVALGLVESPLHSWLCR